VTEQIKSAKDLRVYKRAYALSMEIFELSRAWPAEERYSLRRDVPATQCRPLARSQKLKAERRLLVQYSFEL
jgi:hypothetical protein